MHQNSALHKRLQSDGIPVVALPSISTKALWSNAKSLAQLAEEQETDVLHFHHKMDLKLAVLAKILSKQKFKLVYTRHMHIASSKKDPWHRFFYKRIDLFITITEQMRQTALRYIPLPANAIKCLYSGVKAPAHFQVSNCQNLFAEEKYKAPFRVAIFARIERNKGQHLVLEAAKALHDNYPALHYYIFGLPSDEAYHQSLLQQVAQEGLSDYIHFKGFHTQPTAIMPCFDVVLLPSLNESFGLVLPEAMRAGVAVIGSNFGGIPEIIDDMETGMLFENGNTKDLASKLKLLYQNKELREKLAKQGKQKADRIFSEEQHYLDLEQLYLSYFNLPD
ncbi:glycosyltransferase family 4 protein [Pontibacter sp. 13R65]|uniref:glycosyltransferase family 4 protein n=1 Tax=Pontibacter sp. 13R65 TaxID=3127458 RepID=UPI00301E5C50